METTTADSKNFSTQPQLQPQLHTLKTSPLHGLWMNFKIKYDFLKGSKLLIHCVKKSGTSRAALIVSSLTPFLALIFCPVNQKYEAMLTQQTLRDRAEYLRNTPCCDRRLLTSQQCRQKRAPWPSQHHFFLVNEAPRCLRWAALVSLTAFRRCWTGLCFVSLRPWIPQQGRVGVFVCNYACVYSERKSERGKKKKKGEDEWAA